MAGEFGMGGGMFDLSAIDPAKLQALAMQYDPGPVLAGLQGGSGVATVPQAMNPNANWQSVMFPQGQELPNPQTGGPGTPAASPTAAPFTAEQLKTMMAMGQQPQQAHPGTPGIPAQRSVPAMGQLTLPANHTSPTVPSLAALLAGQSYKR